MAAINHDVTEKQLEEIYAAIRAVQKEKGHNDTEACFTADTLRYAVFRGILTYESVIQSIITNARKAFSH